MGLSAGFIGISVGIVTFKYYGSDMHEGSSIQEYWGPKVDRDVTAKNVLISMFPFHWQSDSVFHSHLNLHIHKHGLYGFQMPLVVIM